MAKTAASIAQAFRTTLDLHETGVALMRQNLRRADPQATDQEIHRRLCEWLHTRPGAELGDVGGPLVDVTHRYR
jgi:hypothetical protein